MENQAKLARKVSPAAKETMANQVQLDPQDHPDHQAQLEAMANPERKANLEEMPNKAAKVRLDPKEKRDHQDPLDPMETKDPAAKLVHPAQLDHPDHQDKAANQATKEVRANPGNQANQVQMPTIVLVHVVRPRLPPRPSNKSKYRLVTRNWTTISEPLVLDKIILPYKSCSVFIIFFILKPLLSKFF